MATLSHIQLNVSDATKSLPFYKDLFNWFGYKIIDESTDHIGASNGTTDFWIIQTEEKHKSVPFHRKQTGINHLAFQLESKEKVDEFVKNFLQTKNNTILYNSPKYFPEYSPGYYAVFFEDPDRLKLEVMVK